MVVYITKIIVQLHEALAAYRLEIMLQMKREEAELEADGKMDY